MAWLAEPLLTLAKLPALPTFTVALPVSSTVGVSFTCVMSWATEAE